MNVMLVTAFKKVYKQLDSQKTGYIDLSDLCETVKKVDGEARRNSLIKFFVAF